MKQSFRTRLVELAKNRPLQILTVAALVVTTAAGASPLTQTETRQELAGAMERAVAVAAPAEVQPPRLVWEGADVDSDGRPDFANPTGQETRGHDKYGEGEFGARRDGGSRRHEGVDFVADPGQQVVAPISGYVTKIGCAYVGDATLKFVEITNPALRYAARVFYVNPEVQVGDTVAIGDTVGTARSLQRKYPRGMTNHVHLELIDARGVRINAATMIVAAYQPSDRASAD